jgi:DNA modification methylase
MTLKIESLPIDKLTFDPSNARKHSDVNLAAIAESLKQFGQRKPIVITAENVIVAGNGTVEAARFLGLTDIDVVRVPKDWSADQVKAFALADNRTAELAEWDDKVLQTQLAELLEAGFEIAKLGFEVLQPAVVDVETFEDEVPELPGEPITRLGDVWLLGNHRLVCGDSGFSAVVQMALAGEQADCVFTDPPYNVDYTGGTKDHLSIQNDSMSAEKFDVFLENFYRAAFENTKAGGPIYVCHAHMHHEHFKLAMEKSGWMLKQCLVWAKDRMVLSRQDYNWQHEAIHYGWKPGAAHSWHGPFTNTTVIDFEKKDWKKLSKEQLIDFLETAYDTTTIVRAKRPHRNDIHPTMKPIELVAKLLKNSVARNDLVLDPFAGSGSTLITCEQLGLRSANVEIDPKYCDVIVERWQTLTGEKAVLENAGR